MDAALFVSSKDTPGVQYRLKAWAKNGDHEHVILVDVATEKEHEAPLDDVFFDDPTAPNVFQALKTVRDFQRHEMSRVRRGSPESRGWVDTAFEEMFLELFLEMQPTGRSTSTLGCNGLGPLEMRLHEMQENWHKNLDDLPEDMRDAKTCSIAVERDILQYAHVPERHRTDETSARYLVAKRAKRKRDEAAVAEAEKKAVSDAVAEEKKASRRAAEKVKRDAKKAKNVAVVD